MTPLGQVLLALYFLLFNAVGACLILAGVAFGLVGVDSLAELNAAHWILLAPFLYLAWLLLFLMVGAADVQFMVWAWRFNKPERVVAAPGVMPPLQLLFTLGNYVQAMLVWSLPMSRSLLAVPWLRHLVFLAYAPSTHLGRECQVFGCLYDPDLTFVGDFALLGGDCVITCHSATTQPDGSFVYASAPVHIGARAVIGGQARLGLGVRIGEDAVVEAGSIVAPFSVIGTGEVWGGNPAVFRRHRFAAATGTNAGTLPTDRVEDAAIRQVVADALGLARGEVHDDLSTMSCAAWDSLGQMALAAGLHARFGVDLPADQVFQLQSLQDIRRALAGCISKQPAAAPPVLPGNPELLPLFDPDDVTQGLAARTESSGEKMAARELRVVIAATFTAEPVVPALKLWSGAFGVPVGVEFAGFDQVSQALLAADGAFHSNPTGLNVVLTRPEDMMVDGSKADEMLGAIEVFCRKPSGTLVVCTLPPVVSASFAADRADVNARRVSWQQRLAKLGVLVLDFSAMVEEIGLAAAGARQGEVLARAPYSPRIYQHLGIGLARLVRRHRVPAAKVLALDADGILWGGVLAEEGMHQLDLGTDGTGRAFRMLQQQILQLKNRGVLLVLVSRNQESDVWQVFDEHPGMILRRPDIAAARINWQPKSQNLRELAAELNLGLDSFVFLDDDPAVRLEVTANASGVIVVPLPADPADYGPMLARLWCFDAAQATAEDSARTTLMHEERERRDLQQAVDLPTYLRGLQLKARLRPAEQRDQPRVAQLTQKTNQFNLSLRRRTVADLQALGAEFKTFVVEASDRFGDYGLIGVCILAETAQPDSALELDTFLLSCRALGRGIEDALVNEVFRIVRMHGSSRLHAPFVQGPRNQPVRDFLVRAGFQANGNGTLIADNLAERPVPAHLDWQAVLTNHDKSSQTSSRIG